MRKSTKITAVVGGVALTVAGAGVAYAFYGSTASGSVDGSAAAATVTVANVTPTAASAISGLVPGGTAQTATITLTNSNPYSVRIPSGKSLSVASVTAGPSGCADNAVALLSGTAAIPATTLAKSGATGSTMTVDVPVSMADSSSVDQTSCNGGSFTVTYSVG